MRPRMNATTAKPAKLTRPLLAGLSGIFGAALSIACSGEYPAIGDAPLVTSPDRSVSLSPVTQVPASPTRSVPSPDAGLALDPGTKDGSVGGSVDASPDATLDASPIGCVEPEPNGNPITAPQLPNNFTCGQLSDGVDVDYFLRTTVPGDRTIRVVAPAGPAGDALVVTVTVQGGGSSYILGRNDTLVVSAGVRFLFQVRSMTNSPTTYGILVER